MDARLDVGGIVVQQIEHVMALVLVGADDAGIERLVLRSSNRPRKRFELTKATLYVDL